MKIVVISDTHGFHNLVPELPEADLFIHAGDFMNGGKSFEEIHSFNNWLHKVPAEIKLICAGNHDILFDETHRECTSNLASRARGCITNGIYMQDGSSTINGVKFYFSPWTPRFFDWGFNVDRGEAIAKIWAKIPEDTEVLVTHGPPHGILDQIVPGAKTSLRGHRLGCEELYKRIKQLRNIKYHVFGHIHGSRGQMIYRFEDRIVDPIFVNASFLNENYKPYPGPGYFMLEI